MPKIVKWMYLLLLIPGVSFGATCEVQAVKRDIDVAENEWAGPAYAPSCEANGAPLQINSNTKKYELSLDLKPQRIDIICDFSMNAFVEVSSPLLTIGIVDEEGSVLDGNTGWTDSKIQVAYWPDNPNSFESLDITCVK